MFKALLLPVLSGAVEFLARNYRYKSVGTQISHDAAFAPMPCTGRKIHPPPSGIEPAPRHVIKVLTSECYSA